MDSSSLIAIAIFAALILTVNYFVLKSIISKNSNQAMNEDELEKMRLRLSLELREQIVPELREEIRRSQTETGAIVSERIKSYSQMMGDFQNRNAKAQVASMEVQTKSLEAQERRLFELNQRLEMVYQNLGEMQNMARGMEDIKKVLSNVKTRGILGELQLKMILEEILAPSQYEENVATKLGSKDRVEFAIRLPEGVMLPIDSKFPADMYGNLVDAYDSGDKIAVSEASSNLKKRLRLEAKTISEKYIDPPNTTDFAVMFLPFEGLYVEAVNQGLVESLQRDYKVCIAGPTTFIALLSSLQMGFKTLAIQKKSNEAWGVLSEVKEEFQKFDNTLARVQTSLLKAQDELEKLVGVRTRVMIRKLDKISAFEDHSDKSIEKDIEEEANEAARDVLKDLPEEELSAGEELSEESHGNHYQTIYRGEKF